jgi:hypothetical protein
MRHVCNGNIAKPIIVIVIISSGLLHSPLDKSFSKFSPFRSIFGYSYQSPVSRPAQIVTPTDLRAS